MITPLAVAQFILASAGVIVAEEVLRALSTRAVKRAGAGATIVRDVGTGLRVIALAFVAVAFLNLTGLASDFTALTFSGIGALALSLALQTTLSNVIAGLLLFNDGAIRLNDDVEFGGVRGKVARIALRNTWIKTESGTIVIVSNSSLSSGPLANHTASERLSKRYAI